MAIGECPNPQPDCKYAPSCYGDSHHEVWPRRDYKTGVEKRYRRLGVNIVQLCRSEHEEIHAGPPPEKPSRDEMLQAINEARDE